MEETTAEFLGSSCIRTVSGALVDPFNPDPSMLRIEDIAHALARIPRFGGHTYFPWSVAQHSLAGAALVPDEHKLAFLLHDSSEAYLLDVPKPIKKRLPEYMAVEERLMTVLASRFEFEYPFHDSIKEADQHMLLTERQQFLLQQPNEATYYVVQPWLNRHEEWIRRDYIREFKHYQTLISR
ncbi:MAG TPA: hypothetical protein PLB89_05245 [Flavobacteriales bacterium]|nr:hypothetical protein [Flavobacteriales bacterium]